MEPPLVSGETRSRKLRRDPRVRRAVKLTLDLLAACAAMVAACAVLGQRLPTGPGLAAFALLGMAVNAAFKFYAQHYRAVGLRDAWALVLGNLAMATGVLAVCLLRGQGWPGGEPAKVVLGASLLLGPLWFGLRMACLALHRRRAALASGREGAAIQRVLIVGAGQAGILLCQELQDHPGLCCRVQGFVDDALEKQGLRIQGVPVLGPTALLPLYIREQRASQVILAMAGAPGARLRELAAMARAEGAEVKTVPGIHSLVAGQPWKPEVRDIAIEDLLRRAPITLDTVAMRAAVAGAVVLITGGGGSIGSELARTVAGFGPERVVLLGRGENSLWQAQRQLTRLLPRQQVAVVLCDIRNRARLDQVFQTWRPEVVLHAAAHKHVPFLEENPEEAIENNIFGTRNIMEAALEHGTRTFVNISTDKAVNPVSVLGVSKRIAELVVAREAAVASSARLVSVRFGNVLGSRGSVIPIFMDQIQRGGPVTVTHPDMVRYFMTIQEAAQLVLQAGLLGDGGKVFVLDMGEPVRIVELAREMVRLSGFCPGADMDIRYTGLRPGEKLFEELFASGEERRTQVHPKVFEAVQDPQDPARLEQGLRRLKALMASVDPDRQRKILECFMHLVPTYQASPSGLGRFLALDPVTRPGPSSRSAARHLTGAWVPSSEFLRPE
ncbi:MAG: nucleoside-diphosphate sugar epimerase/dehydratase [Holophaga sp.]|nr:nucleoside-diphosphate sugar epimerase/dehydratase [Holophaga sp.]